MTRFVISIALLAILSPVPVYSAEVLKANESILINASVNEVWDKSGNFENLRPFQSEPSKLQVEIVEGTNNEVGAVRLITSPDGEKMKEKLEGYLPNQHTYSYTIIDGPLPVSNYHAKYTVESITEHQSKVSWTSNFERSASSNADAVKIVSALYSVGLNNLKKYIESSSTITDAKQTIKRSGTQGIIHGSENNFTGIVKVVPLFSATEATQASGAYVTFEPGARSVWHTHPRGQTLIITAGIGWTQVEGGPIVEVHPGDVIICPPGQKHWHGASPKSSMTHIAIQENLDGRVVNWLEKVTDEEYLHGPSR